MKQTNFGITKSNEDTVQEYFKNRGFSLQRLDESGNSDADKACEWLIEAYGASFLCEVKTIESVQRGRNVESEFKNFAKQIVDYFHAAKIGRLAYKLRIDSNDLYTPTQEERNLFFQWLKNSILDIEASRHPLGWQVDNQLPWLEYWCSYLFRTPETKGNLKVPGVNVVLSKTGSDGMEVDVHWYGGLNTTPIEKRVKKAMGQLRSAAKGNPPSIARLIVLAFASKTYTTVNSEVVAFSGLEFKEKDLWDCITSLLQKYKDLGAIAILDWGKESFSPQKRQGLPPMSAREFFSTFNPREPSLPCFWVLHNENLQSAEPLDRKIFDDGRSVQYFNLSSYESKRR